MQMHLPDMYDTVTISHEGAYVMTCAHIIRTDYIAGTQYFLLALARELDF